MKKIYLPTIGEEVANSISHGVFACFALFALPIASVIGYNRGGWEQMIGLSVFMISIFLMLITSTLYHAMAMETKHKEIFQILDHIFIYVAIAGTYTPIALTVIGGWQGIVVVAVQWSMVLFGILYKAIARRSIGKLSLAIYLIMGWTVVFFFPMFFKGSSTALLIFIAFGGIMYTIGAIFYAMKGFKYHHFVWHMFIDLALASHAIGLLLFM